MTDGVLPIVVDNEAGLGYASHPIPVPVTDLPDLRSPEC